MKRKSELVYVCGCLMDDFELVNEIAWLAQVL
jgi:hypothetical protein